MINEINDLIKNINSVDFTLPILLGEKWDTLSKIEKLKLGKAFKKAVDSGMVNGVIPLDKDNNNYQWYRKI